MRTLLRHTIERILIGTGVARRRRHRLQERAALVAYHNVVADQKRPGGDTSLHVPLDDFRRQLDGLVRTHHVVALDQLKESDRDGERPLAALTFDDAYAGALKFAVPELVRRSLPATIFVCPGLLDGPGFWWDLVSEGSQGVSASRRERALQSLGGRQESVLKALESGSNLPPHLRPGTLEALRQAAEKPGITLATHTWSHPNLAALSADEIEEELRRSRDWLVEHFPDSTLPTHISFPYGLFNETVVTVATELGFDHLYRIDGGLARLEGAPPHLLPRINVPAGVSLRGFELRTSGVLG